MSAALETNQEVQTLEIVRDENIDAPIEIVWESLLAEIGPDMQVMTGKPMPMKLEPWPGGRWFRDLGNNTGHFWGHVQVIKPPGLLEIFGPMPMSYPAMNHVQYKLTGEGKGTRLKFTHKAIGLIPQEHRDGMPEGWEFSLKRIREHAERLRSARGKTK